MNSFVVVLVLAGCGQPADPPPVTNAPAPNVAATATPREILVDLARWDAATTADRRAAAEDVARRMPDFALLRLETFSCGGQTHEIAIYRHAKTEMEFVLVPGGTFVMGSPPEEPDRMLDETRHSVTLTRPFLVARTETTQATWTRVMGTDPSRERGPDHPVEMVSWDDANSFCAKTDLSLPTEAQWDRASRAGTETRYYFGDDPAALGEYAWYESEPDARRAFDWGHPDDAHHSHPVGRKKPNAFGLFDTLGNVSEWCADMVDRYPEGAVVDPTVPMSRNRGDPVHRGGCWGQLPKDLRSAYRSCQYPDHLSPGIGFRPAKTVPTD